MHGGSFSDCPDEKKDWFPQRDICWPAAELEVVKRMYQELHKDQEWHDGTFTIWSDKFSKLTPWHYTDGVSIWLAPVDADPEDEFLTDKHAKPRSLRERKG